MLQKYILKEQVAWMGKRVSINPSNNEALKRPSLVPLWLSSRIDQGNGNKKGTNIPTQVRKESKRAAALRDEGHGDAERSHAKPTLHITGNTAVCRTAVIFPLAYAT